MKSAFLRQVILSANAAGITIARGSIRGLRVRLAVCCVGHASHLAAAYIVGRHVLNIRQRGAVVVLHLNPSYFAE